MNQINNLLKHPFVNKTSIASAMRPEVTREVAQKWINARLTNNTDYPFEEISKALPELKALNSLLQEIIFMYDQQTGL